MESAPVELQRPKPILYGHKKGADRRIYLCGAIDCLNAINANDPRPKRAVALDLYDQEPVEKPVTTNRDTPKAVYLRERSPCPRIWKLSIFHTENKSKNSSTLKNNTKTSDKFKKNTKKRH